MHTDQSRSSHRMAFRHRTQPFQIPVRLSEQFRIVSLDCVIRQLPQLVAFAARGEILEGADAQMAGGNPGQDSSWQRPLTIDRLTGSGHRKRTRSRNAKPVHGFSDQILAQHRPDCGLSIATARKPGAPTAL